ncbi:hypothetical protein TKK_0011578 [Trichogramma kaykai]
MSEYQLFNLLREWSEFINEKWELSETVKSLKEEECERHPISDSLPILPEWPVTTKPTLLTTTTTTTTTAEPRKIGPKPLTWDEFVRLAKLPPPPPPTIDRQDCRLLKYKLLKPAPPKQMSNELNGYRLTDYVLLESVPTKLSTAAPQD